MGCGSSSLKGDDPTGVGGAAEDTRPARKVNTNFSMPDYDTNANKGRRMTEYAPHETVRPKSPSPDLDDMDPAGGPGPADDKIKPYQTLGDNQDQSYPHEAAGGSSGVGATTRQVNGDSTGAGLSADPTSQAAKDHFATANDPANNAHASATNNLDPNNTNTIDPETGKERKRSWLGEKYKNYADKRDNRPPEGERKFTDDELKKYTGKSNEEVRKMVEEGRGVGARQSASMRDSPGVGTGMGLGLGYGGAGGGGVGGGGGVERTRWAWGLCKKRGSG